ncbi:MAG: twin-arginine translocase TatA/TatE family subunit [Bacteroidota bacterium]
MLNTLLFLNIGTSELILVLLVVVIFFGPKKIPQIAKGIAKGMREFNSKADEIKNEINKEAEKVNEKEDSPVLKDEKNNSDSF